MRVITKYLGLICAVSLLTTAGSTSSQPHSATQNLTGEVIDTICAEHKGHQYMMQQMKSMGMDKPTCIQKCMQLGGKLALYSEATDTVYVITNPDQALALGGRMVQVSGTVNKKKLTISEIKAID
jgi:hypothetical protein